MKTIFKKWFVGLLAAVATLAGGCSDPDGIVEELDVDRVFSPLNFEVLLENNVNATFSWTVSNGIEAYQLDLQYEDGSSYHAATIPVLSDQTTLTYALLELPGKTKFVANLYALSPDPNVDNSKPAQCIFETGVEQLFLNDGVIPDADITATTAVLRWLAGSNVTHLEVDNGIGALQLDETAKAEGVYTLTGLTTGTFYTVNLCRDTAVRGTTSFTASDKQSVALLEKGANELTIGWPETAAVDEVRISPAVEAGESFKLTSEEQAAHAYTVKGLKSLTEYTVTIYIAGVESGSITAQTLGKTTKWDFTTWETQEFTTPTTIDGLLINANAAVESGKEMYISTDADLGCNYLDLKGKSSNVGKAGQAPTDRTVMFSVDGEGVISIDCYANGAGRHFAVYVESLGTDTEKFEAPVKANRGKVYIPITGITGSTNLYIWTDQTINHVYSIEWTEGSEAPGQFAEPLATPVVTVTPTEATIGDQTALSIAWEAVENAASYTWALKGATDAEGNPIGGTTTELKAEVAASVVATLAPGTYTASVVAVPASTYLYKNSVAGTADFTVSDLVLSTPVVKLDVTKVEQGTEQAVVASWEAVNNAASYRVSFNGAAAVEQTELTYTIDAATVAALAVGQYTLSVVAVPAAEDVERQESAAGEAKLTIEEPVAPPTPGVGSSFHWGHDYFGELIATYGTGDQTANLDMGNGLIYYVGAAGKWKVGSDNTSLTDGTKLNRIQFGGTGKTDIMQNVMEFTADGPGTLEMTIRSGSKTEVRFMNVSIDGALVAGAPFDAPKAPDSANATGDAPATYTIDCSAASAGSKILIYTAGSGINLYDLKWTGVSAEPEPEPEPKTLVLNMADLHAAGTTGIPSGTDATVALGENWSSWSWESINFESRCALTTSGNTAGDRVPVFYLYKISKVAAGTFVRNTTPLGEIKTVTVTLIDNGAKKGSYFTMSENVAGVKQTLLSSNDNASNVEHVYTFTPGNDGTFEFANPSDQDCKVVSIVIDYVQ